MIKLNTKLLCTLLIFYIYVFIVINSFPLMTTIEVPRSCNLGSLMLIFGGWFGIMVLATSTKFIKNNNFSYSVRYAIVGLVLLAFNLIFVSGAYRFNVFTMVFGFDILSIPIFMTFYIVLFYLRKIQDKLNYESSIRKVILDFGTKLTRLKVDEISEITGAFHKTIIKVVREMQKNKEIYARYFKSSNTVVFNQDANIEEIDRLRLVYDEWEKTKYDKLS